VQPQGFVCHELSGHGEDSSEDSEEDDNTKRDQFRRNPLETAKSLGDGVCCRTSVNCSLVIFALTGSPLWSSS